MFSFPVTVVVRIDEAIYPLDVTIDIDKIAVVKPLLDKDDTFGVESHTALELIPSSEIILEDGRKLPVLETTAIIFRYLDAYRQLEGFFATPVAPPAPAKPASMDERGIVIPLFGNRSCDSSKGSTPD